MRRLLFMLVCALTVAAGQAQKITRSYQNVSLSEALRQLDEQTDEYTISFLYNELEDFRITTTVRRRSVTDAIRQMIGFYPIRMTVEGSEIAVECTHKTDRHLTGTITDRLGQPVAYANVAILHPADSTLLCGGVSNESGYFAIPYDVPAAIDGSTEGAVLARISCVGYKTIYKLCRQPDVGTVRMQPDTYTIKGVVVKGDIPQYQMTAGGMTINIQGTLLSHMGTAADVLGQLPRVSTTPDGGVSVYGKGTPLIYINNRPLRDKAELAQLKSDDIKSVDVISAPGAQYDATVESVIRIRTVRPKGDGFSLRTSAKLSHNDAFSGAEDLSLKYRTGGLEVFFNGAYDNVWRREDTQLNDVLYGLPEFVYIEQSARTRMRYADLSGKWGLNYDVNDSSSVGLSYKVGGDLTAKATSVLHQDIYYPGYGYTRLAAVEQTMDMDSHDGPDHDLNVYYVGKLGRLAVDFNGTAYWKRFRRNDESMERSQEVDDRDIHISSGQRNNMLAAKLVLGYPVWKGELKAGTEVTHTKTNGFNDNNEGYVASTETDIHENNTALFGEYSVRWGHVTARAGLRYEHVDSRYYLYDELQPALSRTYSDWFPNASVAWNKGKWGVQLNYSKRTQRPGYWQLRNSVQYDNRYSYEGGNPELLPSIRHGVQLDVLYDWLTVQAYYNYTKNVISWLPTLYEDQAIAMLTNRNFDHRQSVYVSLTAAPKFGWYQPTWEVNCARMFFDAARYGSELAGRRAEWEVHCKNRFQLGKTCWAAFGVDYIGPWFNSFQKNKETLNVGGSLSKSFLDKALTVRLAADDIFKTRRERWTNYGLGVNMMKSCYNYTRRVTLTVTYNLNATRSKYKGTGAGNDEKNRL